MKFIRRRSSLTDVSFTQALHSETQAPLEGAESYGCHVLFNNPYECNEHCRKVILGVSWVISGRRYDDGPPPWDIMGV